jgi:hypothetical protein
MLVRVNVPVLLAGHKWLRVPAEVSRWLPISMSARNVANTSAST